MSYPDANSFTARLGAHPLTPLALGNQDLQRRMRRSVASLRKLLVPERRAKLTSDHQVALINGLREDHSRLFPAPAEALRVERDLVKLSTELMANPCRLHELFKLELKCRELQLEPYYWAAAGSIPGDFVMPKLTSTKRETHPSAQLCLPLACTEAAEACINLASEALDSGTIEHWEIQDCEIVLRLLLLNSLLCEAGKDAAQAAQARFAVFSSEGMKLWKGMAERIDWQSESVAVTALWDRPLRMRVLKTLRLQLNLAGLPRLTHPDKRFGLDDGRIDRGDAARGGTQDELDLDDDATAVTPGFVQVITSPIPPATYREDREAIAQYAALREPVPVAALPPAQDVMSLLQAQQAEFPWAEAAIGLLRERLVTASLLGVAELHLPPVLLVGPPGCGKSRFLRRLAQRLQLPHMPLSLAGAHDAKVLTGTGRGWASGDASPLVRLLLQHRSASAFVVLDELDKLSRNGEASSALGNLLLGLLEPETASRWRDGFLQATCDLSRVIFWGTANSLEGIGRPLLSRMELVVMRGPSPEHLPDIAAGIAADLEQQWQLPAGTLPPVPEAIWGLGADNLRTMRRALLGYLYQWVQEHRLPERLH